MQNIIQELVNKAGLSEEQALKSITVMKEFIREKIPPGFSAMVDNFFGTDTTTAATSADNTAGVASGAAAAASATDPHWSEKARATADNAADKIEDFAEDAADKMKDFAKNANSTINEWLKDAEASGEDVIGKIKGMFSGDKKDNPGT